MKAEYGKIIITALAEEDIMNNTEGILFSEFDRLASELNEVVKKWNATKHHNLLTIKMQEEDEY